MDTTATDPRVGTLLDGRYRVGPRIARGGMATVYEATDTRLDRVVAVKILHAGYADDEQFVARFVREARAAARLAHPNAVGVFDQGDDAGTLFLAMEYVPGCTLRDLIREQAPLPPSRALALLEPVLSALAAAHDAGFVHRDVKPENVLLTDDGRVKVADFGLARAVTTSTSTATTGVLIGTVSYLAPELVTEGHADARSDVYSAGVLLYELLTGHKPHQGETPIQVAYKHVHEDVPAPSETAPGIPAYVDALVARATARQRDARPADAKVFLHQLRRVRNALEHGVLDDPELTEDLTPAPRGGEYEPTVVVAPTPEHAESEEPPSRRPGPTRKRLWGWVIFAVVLLLAAAAAAGGWYLSIGRYMTTPDVTGLTLTQAQRQLRSTDLEMQQAPRSYSETVPDGEIISTEPEAGSTMLRDGTLTVVVSKGKERYPMPSVVGLPEAEATSALTEGNLAVGDVVRQYSEKVDEGLVISASEDEGTQLRPDTDVDLVVSKGREPIDVPDVVGLDRGEARSAISDRGLEVQASRRHHDEVAKGDVIAQDPSGGTLFRGDPVQIVVSKGPPLVEVPGVFGRFRDTAVERLEEAGFEVDVQKADGYVGFDLVSSQSPSSSEMAPRGSTVTIYLY